MFVLVPWLLPQLPDLSILGRHHMLLLWGKVMKHAAVISVVLFFLAMFVTAPASADPEVRGEVRDMNGTRIVVELPDGSTRRFEVTRETRIFSQGMPAQIKRVLPHSIVRISVKNGKAWGIFVEGAPK